MTPKTHSSIGGLQISFYNKFFLCVMTIGLPILGLTKAQAQIGGVPVWTNRYNGPANDDDLGRALAVDGSGNVFVTGYSYDQNAGGSFNPNFATIKYSGAGVALWTNRYSGSEPRGIAVDGSGNVFVTGYSTGSSSGYDYATIAYSGVGVPLWTNLYNGPGNNSDYANAIAVDASGNVFVTGSSTTSTNYTPAYATIKYSGAGVPLWTNRYIGPGNYDSASAIAVDGSGNVIVTGTSAKVSADNPDVDFATIKYSGAGVALWTNRYNGPGNGSDEAFAVAVDKSNNVFVTGNSYGSGGASPDYATIKYSGAGVALWTNRYNGPGNGSDEAYQIAVDASGNVIVTGHSTGITNNNDYATIKYSGAGVPLWTNRYDGPANNYDIANAMAVDGSGNVFVTGNSTGSSSGYDYATIAYSGAGVPLWTNRYNGPENSDDEAFAVAVDGRGNVFVTGHSYGTNGYADYVTIKYSSAIPPSLAVGRTATNTVVVSWPSPSTGLTLQQSANGVATLNWTNVVTAPTDDGTTKTVIANPSSGNSFYRLHSP